MVRKFFTASLFFTVFSIIMYTYVIVDYGPSEGLYYKISPKQGASCIPVNKFGFLKTHKCGSTTVQNMLLRYVIKHDLNLVMPTEGENF